MHTFLWMGQLGVPGDRKNGSKQARPQSREGDHKGSPLPWTQFALWCIRFIEHGRPRVPTMDAVSERLMERGRAQGIVPTIDGDREGEHKGSSLPWTNGPGKGLRCIVEAILCARLPRVNAAALLFFLSSSTKSLMGRRCGLLRNLLFVFRLC
jgi:hypothetical protein